MLSYETTKKINELFNFKDKSNLDTQSLYYCKQKFDDPESPVVIVSGHYLNENEWEEIIYIPSIEDLFLDEFRVHNDNGKYTVYFEDLNSKITLSLNNTNLHEALAHSNIVLQTLYEGLSDIYFNELNF